MSLATEALATFSEKRNPHGEAHAIYAVGIAALRAGETATARNRLAQAVTLAAGMGDRWVELDAETGLGEALLALGDLARRIGCRTG